MRKIMLCFFTAIFEKHSDFLLVMLPQEASLAVKTHPGDFGMALSSAGTGAKSTWKRHAS